MMKGGWNYTGIIPHSGKELLLGHDNSTVYSGTAMKP